MKNRNKKRVIKIEACIIYNFIILKINSIIRIDGYILFLFSIKKFFKVFFKVSKKNKIKGPKRGQFEPKMLSDF